MRFSSFSRERPRIARKIARLQINSHTYDAPFVRGWTFYQHVCGVVDARCNAADSLVVLSAFVTSNTVRDTCDTETPVNCRLKLKRCARTAISKQKREECIETLPNERTADREIRKCTFPSTSRPPRRQWETIHARLSLISPRAPMPELENRWREPLIAPRKREDSRRSPLSRERWLVSPT
jgi:hypothetical protein